MTEKLTCIMLVDDNRDDNFFHEREISKVNIKHTILTKNSGTDALEYLISKKDPRSDLIFLDINMPGMNGWEFLEQYNLLDKELQGGTVIIMLTTSDNEADVKKAKEYNTVAGFITKPLTKTIMEGILARHLKQNATDQQLN